MNKVVTRAADAPTAVAEMPVERALGAMREKFAEALPAHIPAERFVRAALSALTKKEIAACAETPLGRKSIYDACLRAAADGLLLDGREAALVSYRSKDGEQWINTAQYQPMVAGVMKKARNSGEIASIVAQVVYSNDEFEINYVTDGAPVLHKPNLSDRGERMGAYALARFKDGSWSQPEYMSWAEIEKIKARSKSRDKQGNVVGPWVTDPEEMGRKTVIKRASKYWPSSTDRDGADIGELLRRDDDLYIEGETVEAAPALKTRSAARLLAAEDHDVETGEVVARGSDEQRLIEAAEQADV